MRHDTISTEAIAEPRAFTDQATLLAWLTDFLLAEFDPERILSVASAALGRFLGASRVMVGEVDLPNELFRIALDWTDGVASLAGDQPLYAESWIAREYVAGRTIAADDRLAIPYVRNEAQRLADAGGVFFVSVPMLREGRLAALFAVSDHRPRRWRDAEVALIEQVGGRIWRAHDHLRLQRRLRDSEALLARLEGVAAAPADDGPLRRLWVTRGREQVAIPVTDVLRVEAARDYVLLHTASARHIVRIPMDEIERRVDAAVLLRVQRSTFVAPALIARFERAGRQAVLSLTDGTAIRIGPRYIDRVSRQLARIAPALPGLGVLPSNRD